MSLADRLAEPTHDVGGRDCTLCALLPTLPEGEREALDRALAANAKQGGWSARAVAEAIKAEGYEQVKRSTVEHHRREHMS